MLFLAAVLLIIVVLPLLQVCHNAIHLRLKLSAQASLLLHHLTRGTDKQAETLREALRSASKDGLETRLSKEKLYGEDAMLVRNFVHGTHNETTNDLVTKLLPERESESNLHSGPGSRAATPFHSLTNNTFTHSNTNTDSSGASTQPPATSTSSTNTTSAPLSEDRTSTTSNPLVSGSRGSARSSASQSPSTTSEQNEESDSAEPTFWQRCTMHNFNMTLLQNLAVLKLVELSYTPTVVVEDSLVLSTTNSYALHAE